MIKMLKVKCIHTKGISEGVNNKKNLCILEFYSFYSCSIEEYRIMLLRRLSTLITGEPKVHVTSESDQVVSKNELEQALPDKSSEVRIHLVYSSCMQSFLNDEMICLKDLCRRLPVYALSKIDSH
jgi:hypothetical protein